LEGAGVRLPVVDLSVYFGEDFHRHQTAGVYVVLSHSVRRRTPIVIEHQLQKDSGVEISRIVGFVCSGDGAIGHGIAAGDEAGRREVLPSQYFFVDGATRSRLDAAVSITVDAGMPRPMMLIPAR
jgi:hypothetical protein